MAEKLTNQERLEKLQKKQEQLKAREKALKARISTQERKARTKRLIEIGALVESALGRKLEEKDREKLSAYLKQSEEQGKYISKAIWGE